MNDEYPLYAWEAIKLIMDGAVVENEEDAFLYRAQFKMGNKDGKIILIAKVFAPDFKPEWLRTEITADDMLRTKFKLIEECNEDEE